MPVHNPPPASGGGGGGGGSNVSVDADGYINVTGTPFAYKFLDEDLGGGATRVHLMIRHATLGEASFVFSDPDFT